MAMKNLGGRIGVVSSHVVDSSSGFHQGSREE